MRADAAPLSGITTRLLRPESLGEIADEWDRWSGAALEENAFYTRPYVMAGLRHLGDASGFHALCIFRQLPDGKQRLIGLLPLRRTRFRYGVPGQVDLAAQNVFQTSGTPLIDRDDREASVDALLDAAGRGAGLAPNLLIPNVRRDNAFARLLTERAAIRGFDADFIGLIRRPVLTRREEDAEAYVARSIAPKRLRELRRTHRRLAETGALAFHHVTDPAGMAGATEDFLRIEAAGWKGAAGTALLCQPDTAAFARAAFSGTSGGAPIASADILALDGQAIAISLNLQVGRTSFPIKCAYDEAYRRFSPGLVLEHLVVEHLFSSRFADELDSCVTQDGHVIQDLWSDSVEVGTVALRPRGARIGFGPLGMDLAQAEQHRARLRARVKERYLAARELLVSARALAQPAATAKPAH